MNFLKMHGLGNDFVILDQRNGVQSLAPAFIRDVSNRHTGVGCDQLIVMEPSEKADVFMRIYNADGSQAQACGNATRCVARLVMQEKSAQACNIETVAGVLPCRLISDDLVEVDMGEPGSIERLDKHFEGFEAPLAVEMGNPHVVFFVNDAEGVPLSEVGPVIETDQAFPDKTNVEFVHVNTDGSLRLRVWERGAGITMACGSGACATIVAAIEQGMIAARKADIAMDGGVLHMEWRESDGHVLMTGPVAYVFEGGLRG